LGFHSARSPKGSHASLHPNFVRPGNAAHFLIRAAKTSHTTGTLCAIWAAVFVKLEHKTIEQKIKKIYNKAMKIIIETDRLFLRELFENDYDDLCKILQDKDVMYAYEHAFSDEEVKTWFNKQIERYNKNGFGLWAVINKGNNEFLGQCGLTIQNINDKEYLEIGYLFKKEHWHKGYATESALGCKKYAFETLKAEKIYSIIRENNISSQNVAKRIGMEKVDEIMKHYYDMDMLHYVFQIKK
jgi:RimJ/RimL family protein N-acetyltransferase